MKKIISCIWGISMITVLLTGCMKENETKQNEEINETVIKPVTKPEVEEAIGKTAGESFKLWYEGGDGLYGYEYTIQEVVGKSVGDTFRIKQESPEWSESYLYTIGKIEKVIEYGGYHDLLKRDAGEKYW